MTAPGVAAAGGVDQVLTRMTYSQRAMARAA